MLGYIIGLAGILWGTVTDLKTREVPDWINYGMLSAGAVIATHASLTQVSWIPFAEAAAGALGGYLLGALMYYTGQWGGGDAKMMIGLGALFTIPFTTTPFFAYFILATILMGALYGLAWLVGLMIVKRKTVFPALKARFHEPKIIRLRIIVMITCALLVAVAFLTPMLIRILLLVLVSVAFVTTYLLLAVRVVEKVCFIKDQPVEKLTLGDWVIEDVKKGKKTVIKASNTGLTEEELEALKKANIKSVKIKEGIPFVPSFLLAFILAVLWMNSSVPLLFWL